MRSSVVLKNRSDRVFDVFVYLILTVFMVLTVLPFINILAKSLSSAIYVHAGRVSLFPVGFTFEAYELVMGSTKFWRAFGVTVFITVVGTSLNTWFTANIAYALSRKRLPGRRLVGFLYIFTMFFSGGLIPTYLVVRAFGLTNTLWSVIIPTLVIPYHMIIVRNYFLGVPDSLEESARMDGASNVTILYRIYVPISLPAIATISLFYAVDYWNQYFDALIYLTDRALFPLQVYLRELIRSTDPAAGFTDMRMANASVNGATVIASTLPILMVYPFLQRYFVKGIMLGSVKE